MKREDVHIFFSFSRYYFIRSAKYSRTVNPPAIRRLKTSMHDCIMGT